MARLALIVLACGGTAAADPPRLSLGVSEGIGWASRAGTYRDDGAVALRATLPVHGSFALDLALHEDIERLEPAFGMGVRLLLDRGCYVRGELAIVGATQLGSNFDATAGLGFIHDGLFVEASATDRFGDVDTLGFHVEAGVSLGL
jgi:hypothetical protein